MAIVDDQRCASLPHQPFGHGLYRFVASGRGLYDLAIAIEGQPARSDEDAPRHSRNVLLDGERVEKLVGNDQERAVRGKLVDALVPACAWNRRRLSVAPRSPARHP